MYELFVTIFLMTKVVTTFTFPEAVDQATCHSQAKMVVEHFKLKPKMRAQIECRLREVTKVVQ